MFKVNFMANQMVTAEDINAIGYNLSNTVYTTFTDDTTYGVDELNAITSHIMNKGILAGKGSECAVTVSGDMVSIADGVAFFESGAVMTIDSEGISLNVESGTDKQYVYLFFNSDVNVAGARCTTAEPSGDFVMLATIENGTVTMDRTYATLKAEVYTANEVKTATLNVSFVTKTLDGYSRPFRRYETDFVVTSYNEARISAEQTSGDKELYIEYDIQNQCPVLIALKDEVASYYGFGKVYSYTYMQFEIVDGKLRIDICDDANSPYDLNVDSIYCEFYGGATV